MLNTKMFSKNLLKGFSNGQKFSNNIIKNFNLKQFGGKKDWDFDGVTNKKDCQPRNTMRQDWDTSRLRKAGFYVTSMRPKEYLKRTRFSPSMIKATYEDKTNPFNFYYDTETKQMEPLSKLQEHIKGTTKVEVPFVFGGEDQEGRHRALAAYRLGIEKIPVVVNRPSHHVTPDIAESFLQKTFPKSHETYKNEWKQRFNRGIPEKYMDKETFSKYKEVLEEKGIKDIEGDYIEPASIEKQQEWQNKSEMEKDVDRITKKDTDTDGVVDDNDCQPLNDKEHGGQLFWQKLKEKNIPIAGTKKSKKHIRHFFEKNPELMQQAQGTVIIGDSGFSALGSYHTPTKDLFESAKQKFPNYNVLGDLIIWNTTSKKITPIKHELKHKEQFYKGIENKTDEQVEEDIKTYNEQFKKFEEEEKKAKYEWKQKYNIIPGTKKENLSEEARNKIEEIRLKFKELHYNLPGEREAFEYEKQPRERDIKPPEEEVTESFRQTFEENNNQPEITEETEEDNGR